MQAQIYQVDSFSDKPFRGNPAGVCLLEKPAPEKWMQQLAMEMNLSETAFCYPLENGYRLRWFTPIAEVELCGHATLATAHVLFETGAVKPDQMARFQTMSGWLTVTMKNGRLQMDFPATPAVPCNLSPELPKALGLTHILWSGKNEVDYLIEVGSEEEVVGLRPDFRQLAAATQRGVIVTARSVNPDYDFISRFFAPAIGIDEDPVTGSAHCTLGPYWMNKLKKSVFTAYQASRRGGIVLVEVKEDRILLGGNAVTIFAAQFSQLVRETMVP
ncbi:MAG TPA: PhzF family phenazine biosynthesis isomerase [Candidatus Marinimicrobia bacterium]|nr:PhzF family phenazine biosynthesis isomerase [Candidatus Neomarinimicrobiota bacterium]